MYLDAVELVGEPKLRRRADQVDLDSPASLEVGQADAIDGWLAAQPFSELIFDSARALQVGAHEAHHSPVTARRSNTTDNGFA